LLFCNCRDFLLNEIVILSKGAANHSAPESKDLAVVANGIRKRGVLTDSSRFCRQSLRPRGESAKRCSHLKQMQGPSTRFGLAQDDSEFSDEAQHANEKPETRHVKREI